MKKKTLLAGSLALIAGGMIGAISPVPNQSVETLTKNQVQQESQRGSQSGQEQQPATKNAPQPQATKEIADFGKSLAYAVPTHYANQSRRFYRNVSNGHGGGYNKLTHSRRTKRKHRLA